MKSKIKKIIKKIIFIITCKIPNLFYLVFKVPQIKKILKSNNIKNISIFRFKYWHLGYMYFKGNYNNKDVFIKYNIDKNIIINEALNIEYLRNNSKLLKNKVPFLYFYKELDNSAFLVEDFWLYKKLSKCVNDKYIDYNHIFNDFVSILKEFQRINFMHLDINDSNFFIDESCNVLFLDLGFSLANKEEFDFIDNKKTKGFIIKHLNKYSRLDVGCIDDAVSLITLSSNIYNNFIKDYKKQWIELNKLSNVLFFEDR